MDKQINFPTGNGAFDSRIKVGEDYATISFSQFLHSVESPNCRTKHSAPWVIFSDYKASDARKFSIQTTKGKFYALAGDVDQGNLSKERLLLRLSEVFGDVNCVVYSTYSSDIEDRRWRFVVPLSEPVEGRYYPSMQDIVMDKLAVIGVECDRAMRRTAQLIYLPNRKSEYYDSEIVWPGPFFDPQGLLAESAELLRQTDTPLSEPLRWALSHTRKDRDDGPIARFNRANSLVPLLKKYGYCRKGNQWRSPLQKGSSFATTVIDDRWISLSVSDACLGVSNGQATSGDAFDLFCFFEFDGDVALAIETFNYVDSGAADREWEWSFYQSARLAGERSG